LPTIQILAVVDEWELHGRLLGVRVFASSSYSHVHARHIDVWLGVLNILVPGLLDLSLLSFEVSKASEFLLILPDHELAVGQFFVEGFVFVEMSLVCS